MKVRKLTIDDVDLHQQPVLVRVDFNVPLREEASGRRVVADDTRIRAALPTLQKIVNEQGKAIVLSHLGRPKGKPDPRYSLAPVAEHLQELVEYPVQFVPHTRGPAVEEAVSKAVWGSVVVLENTRFEPGETKNDPQLARDWASLASVFVNDAFGAAHRAHASTVGVAQFVPVAAMGYLMKREVEFLLRVLEAPERPLLAILGGAKVSDKLGVIKALLERVDGLLIGGAMAYTFLKALGYQVGKSLVEEDWVETARELYQAAQGRILLPEDHVAVRELREGAQKVIAVKNIPEGYMGVDIGPRTIERYREKILGSRTALWNGPMGVFEIPDFARGTIEIARALAEVTEQGALTVVGGGDSVAALVQFGYADKVSHVSTGGGAMLEFIEKQANGEWLPGIAVLTDKPE